ncbi:unnamed protein product [Brachionus calyciflorus]|uniref:Uncharacterized protein n=1 Tax=Brachionus calyciflorus TaxID=104777 RepID=A0A813SK55_9BILA|nr:unnamed protein product [Brachionus calyciflorus]
MNFYERDKKKKGLLDFFRSNNAEEKRSTHRKRDGSFKTEPRRRIKEKQPEESIYDEIDIGIDELKSIEEFQGNGVSDKVNQSSSNSSLNGDESIKTKTVLNNDFKIQKANSDNGYDNLENFNDNMSKSSRDQESKTRFKVEKVNDKNNYVTLKNSLQNNMTIENFEDEKKIKKVLDKENTWFGKSETQELPKDRAQEKSKVNFDLKSEETNDDIFNSNLRNINSGSLEKINKIRARGRSKSEFVPTDFKSSKPDEHHLKARRAIFDVFKKIETSVPETIHKQPTIHKIEEFTSISETKNKEVFDENEVQNYSVNNRNQQNSQINKQDSEVDFENKINEKKYSHHEEEEKEPLKSATGISIIYGLVLCLSGIFISLDTLAGNLGEYRVINTIFFVLLYFVGICWIIFVYIDYNNYISKLNKLFEDRNLNVPNKLKRKKSHTNKNEPLYSSENTRGQEVDLYGTRGNSAFQLYLEVAGKNDEILIKYTDFHEKGFSGYLVDRNQPYNMYLTVGIALFCMITLLQCCIGMIEAIENFINKRNDCLVETSEGVIAFFQFIFTCLQFLYIFLRGNIVICRNSYWSHLFPMHIAITNLIVWLKYILVETIDEYYEHILHDFFSQSKPNNYTSQHSSLLLMDLNKSYNNDTELFDCHIPEEANIKKFVLNLKPYLYPATIEFSVTCATIYMIMWHKSGKRWLKCLDLPPTKKNFQDVGLVNIPFSNLLLMLDCTKTSKGLFFGILTFVFTILSVVFFFIFRDENPNLAKLITEVTEISLLLFALIITTYAYFQIRKHYSKRILPMNMFDVVLEIFSLGGVFAYSVNNLIAIFYGFANKDQITRASGGGEDLTKNITSAFAAILQILQSSLQTLLILECLRRYAERDKTFMKKPARELITLLLIVNVSMWFFDTLSAKRFNVKNYLIDYFGILKWSIINAFSAPIAIFYRFHSSVCLSDVWYGLYYGEFEEQLENQEEETKL